MTREPDDEPREDEVPQAEDGEGSEATEPGEAAEGSQAAEKAGAGGGDEADEGTDQVREVAGSGRAASGTESDDAEDGEPAAAGGLLGLIRARGPQKAVLVMASLVVALIVLVGWFVVARGDEESDETEVAADEEGEGASAPEGTEPPEPTTTVPETTTTTLSPEEEAELEVIEAYEAALDARDEASAPPEPDPEHPALEETFTGDQLLIVETEVEVLFLEGLAVRYPEHSVGEVIYNSVVFEVQDGLQIAYLETCEVTDRERFEMGSGDTRSVGAGPQTMELTVEMHEEGDGWKVAAIEVRDLQEGVTGCALDE